MGNNYSKEDTWNHGSHGRTNTLGRKPCKRSQGARRRARSYWEDTPPRSILDQSIKRHSQTHEEVFGVPGLHPFPVLARNDLVQHQQSLAFPSVRHRHRGTVPSYPRRAQILTGHRWLFHIMDLSRATSHSHKQENDKIYVNKHLDMIWHPRSPNK